MKTILLFVTLFVFGSCEDEIKLRTNKLPDGLIGIIKTETGFNIYSNSGELILEYTKQNCDSLSLKTLYDIYYTAKEFYNKKPSEEKPNFKIQKIHRKDYYVQR